jgi:hypothetical protein
LYGADNGACKHEEYEIRNICELITQGLGPATISRLLGYRRGLIQSIILGKAWTHISKEYDFSNYKRRNSYKKYHKEIDLMIYRGYTLDEIYNYMKYNVDIAPFVLKKLIRHRIWGIDHGTIPKVLSVKFQ